MLANNKSDYKLLAWFVYFYWLLIAYCIFNELLIMNTHQLFLSFLLWIIPFTLSGQRYISGYITDIENGDPIPGASVFIANTTVGTTTDTAGYYRLKIPGEGSYRLAISHVGYQPVFSDIETGKALEMRLNVTMQMHEMGDVTVTARVRARKKDVDLFWRTVLGKEPSKKTIHATNPDAAYYYYNSKTRTLKVTCSVPLQIVNNETGYHIQYILDHFTHNYDTDISSWEGQYMFRELEPNNYRQKNTWESNRKKVYQVSVNHFMKTLYQDSLMNNGFLLTYTTMSPDPLFGLYSKPFSTLPGDNYKKLHIPSDSTVLLICFGKPVTDKDIEDVRFAQRGLKKWERTGLFRYMLHTPGDPVQIFPDGNFKNSLQLIPKFSSAMLTGLNMTLPIEYDPNIDSKTIAEDEHAAERPVSPLADTLDRVAKRFDLQLSIFPQEKVHLHTDKPYYISGERIWFRAHVVDAASHEPVFDVNCVYAELFDVRDSIVSRVKTGPGNDLFSGYIPIPADIPEGNYTIRAYTGRMQQLDEDYFFLKNIRIGNPMTHMIQALPEFEFTPDKKIGADIRFSSIRPLMPITPESVKISINNGRLMNAKCENGLAGINFNLPSGEKQRVMLLDAMYDEHSYRKYIRIPLPDDDFDVSFYPEGGSALYGRMGRIAFKAMQQDGTEIDVTGIVYNRQGEEITQFKTTVRGMGQFMIASEQGEAYYAVCTNSKGQSKRFDLPVAKENGYALSATWLKDQLMVEVRQSEVGKTNDTLCLMVHTRGVVQDIRILNHSNEPLIFRKDIFPSGVTNLLLLSKNMVPLSERLVFTFNDDQPNVTGKADRDICSVRSPVEYTVNITGESGEPLLGNISVSVTDDHEVAVDTTANILTTLLLTSDLRGNISDPAFYFQKNLQSAHTLDLLMLTQGWRRYDTERMVRNDFMYPDSLLEKGYEISGVVKSKKQSEKNISVSMLSLHGDYFADAVTNGSGRFYLHDGNAPDSTWFIVRTAPQSDKRDLELTLDKTSYPKRVIPVVASGMPDHGVFAKYADKAEQQYVDEHGTRVVHLSEVAITAQKKSVPKSSFYHTPDRSVTEDQLDRQPPATMSALLMRLPGLTFRNDSVKISRFEGCVEQLLINDLPVTVESLDMVEVMDVVQVDLLTSPTNLAAFGEKGRYGVIAIYTRTSSWKPSTPKGNAPNIKRIMPLGFQKPAEFYAPKYDQPDQNPKPDLRTTINWQPSLTTDETGKASFRFYTADVPSTYTVVVEGMTKDGKIVYKRDKIVVGEK